MSFLLKFLPILSLVIGSLSARGYDEGYEDAWNGAEMKKKSDRDYRAGYEQGDEDLMLMEEGYYSGSRGKKPDYPDDEFYMEGYNAGKKRSR